MDPKTIEKSLAERASKVLMSTYAQTPIALERGEGCRVWDREGKSYLDFLGGIAVTALGHSHPAVTAALREQAGKILHSSNLYYIEPQIALAEQLVRHSFADRVFFCNSGTEANEAAIKLVRRYATERFGPEKRTILCMENSFHGRTMGSLSATGQGKFQKGFEPLLPGFAFAPFNDLAALDRIWDATVAAVLLEPVQGEGGICVPAPDYLREVKKRCRERQALLVLDEVQTGMGRTGTLLAHEQFGVTPDVLTLAKALGNGLPIGALLATAEAAGAFTPGAHAATFGGNHLVTAVAGKVLEIIGAPEFLSRVKQVGAYFRQGLQTLVEAFPQVREARGLGLLLGLALDVPGKPVVEACLERGFLINCTQDTVLRFAPPLIITEAEIDPLLLTLQDIFTEMSL
ncbi:MAG: acetylornithine transaminase [Desulfobacterota bacterium]|jgi:acetylornithine aminotransferase|nr:acetylornithine transaminase [Thermodesulfobacteriota bacterium]